MNGLIATLMLLGLGCARQPWYAPPVQRASMGEASTDTLGPMVAMSDPNANAYVVQGFRGQSEGPWRWALDHPVLRFYLPQVGRINFTMDVTFPEANLRQTGPVTLTVVVNGTTLDRVRFDQPGGHQYRHGVPLELVRQNGINLVAIEPDKTVGRAEGGERLGFVLNRAGFVE